MTPEKEHAEKHGVAPLLKATYKVHSKETSNKEQRMRKLYCSPLSAVPS
jgi:hypothetical protein